MNSFRCDDCENFITTWRDLQENLAVEETEEKQQISIGQADCCDETDLCRSLEEKQICANGFKGKFVSINL